MAISDPTKAAAVLQLYVTRCAARVLAQDGDALLLERAMGDASLAVWPAPAVTMKPVVSCAR